MSDFNYFRRFMVVTSVALGASFLPSAHASLSPVDAAPIQLALAGEWTRCIAFSGRTRYNIVHGGHSWQACLRIAQTCTGDPSVNVRHYSYAVVINAPYLRCTNR